MRRLLFFVFIALVLFAPYDVFAYFPTTTHAGLSEQIVDFYNIAFNKNISAQQREWITQGSIDEDIPSPRALNHFYDPVYNRGINEFGTAKEWALDKLDENSYSWSQSIAHYAQGDEKNAFLGLGHVLHLIEDMGVPEHTRNDPHIGDGPVGLWTGHSPYEDWTKITKTRETLTGKAQELYSDGARPHIFFTPDAYFDFLANYSNNNFFSADTIESGEYVEPKFIDFDEEYGYGLDSIAQNKFKLVKKKELPNGDLVLSLAESEDFSILSSYFDRLSKQIISSGTGIINLFLQEAEIAHKQYEANQQVRTSANIFMKFAYRITDTAVEQVALLVRDTFAITRGISRGVMSFVFSSQRVIEHTGTTLGEKAYDFHQEGYRVITQNTSVIAMSPFVSVIAQSLFPSQEAQNQDTEKDTQNVVSDTQQKQDTQSIESPNKIETEIIQLNLVGGTPVLIASSTKPIVGEIIQQNTIGISTGYSYASAIIFEEEVVEDPTASSDMQSFLEITYSATSTLDFVDTATSSAWIYWKSSTSTFGSISYGTTSSAYASTTLWGDMASTSHSVLLDELSASTTYYFVLFAGDGDGNTASSSEYAFTTSQLSTTTSTAIMPPVTVSPSQPLFRQTPEGFPVSSVIINEIAWRGTYAHYTDEWIELFNTTNEDIDLTGWVIENDTKTFSKRIGATTTPNNYCTASCIISAQGYFLMERTNASTTDQQEDMIYTGALKDNNPGGNLRLKNPQGDIMDKISGWSGRIIAPSRASMERISPYAWGDNSYNWKEYDATFALPFAKDAKNNDIFGTPRAKNSITGSYMPVMIVASSTTWYKDFSPYYIQQVISIVPEAILTIEPGVVVKFATREMPFTHKGGGITVQGGIDARGTETSPIIFTSAHDDTVDGKDTDNATVSPAPRDWTGIAIRSSNILSHFSYVRMTYGGNNFTHTSNGYPLLTGALEITNASPIITNSVFDNNHYAALYITGSSSYPTIASSTISRTQIYTPRSTGVPHGGYGVYIPDIDASARIVGNIFTDNITAVRSKSATTAPLILTDNIFTNNQKNGDIVGNPRWNVVSRNNQDTQKQGGFYVYASLFNEDMAVLTKDTMPYIFYAGFYIQKGSTMIIEPGTVLKSYMKNSTYKVSGTLIARGTPSEQIVFTSFADGSDGYDSNMSIRVPKPGDWKNIHFFSASSSDSIFEHVKIAYGGKMLNFQNCLLGSRSSACGAVMIQNASPTLDAITLTDNVYTGIYITGTSTPLIKNSHIANTTQRMPIGNDWRSFGYGIAINQASTSAMLPTFLNNTFLNNSKGDVVYTQ